MKCIITEKQTIYSKMMPLSTMYYYRLDNGRSTVK